MSMIILQALILSFLTNIFYLLSQRRLLIKNKRMLQYTKLKPYIELHQRRGLSQKSLKHQIQMANICIFQELLNSFIFKNMQLRWLVSNIKHIQRLRIQIQRYLLPIYILEKEIKRIMLLSLQKIGLRIQIKIDFF